MNYWEGLSRHAEGIIIASIGWLLNIPYWVSMYRYHSSLGHSLVEHFYEDLHLHLMALGTIPIFMILGYFWDKKSMLERDVSLRRDFLQAILDNMQDGLVVYDKSRKIIEANKQMETLFGAPREKLLGKECLDLIKCDIEDCPVLTVFERKINVYGGACEQLKHRGGRKTFVEINSYPIKNNGDVEYVLEVIKDITEKILREKEEILLSHIDDLLDSKVEKKKVLREVTESLVREFGYDIAGIAVVKAGGEELLPVVLSVNRRIKVLSGNFIKQLCEKEVAVPAGSPIEKVIKKGRVLFSKNISKLLSRSLSDKKLGRLDRALKRLDTLRYVIIVPIITQGESVHGLIGFASADELRESDAQRLIRIGKKISGIL